MKHDAVCERRAGDPNWVAEGQCTCLLPSLLDEYEAAVRRDERERHDIAPPESATGGFRMTETSSAPPRMCSLCHRPEHGSAACATVASPLPAVPIHVCPGCLARLVPALEGEFCDIHNPALKAEDYPVLARLWDNDEDDDLFSPAPTAE